MTDSDSRWLIWAYEIAAIGTTIYLTFFDGYAYTAWNWLIAVPVNIFLGQVWPLYWLVLHWIG